jgi:hypothetical protein
MLQGEFAKGDSVLVDEKDGELIFNQNDNEPEDKPESKEEVVESVA